VYQIYISGAAANVFCDMTSDGGGWTLVARFNNNGDNNMNTNAAYNGVPTTTSNSAKISHAAIQSLVSGSTLTNPVKVQFPDISVARYIPATCTWTSPTARNMCAAWATTSSSTTYLTKCGASTSPSLNNGNGGEWPSSTITWPYQDGTCALNGGFASAGPNGCSANPSGDAFCAPSSWSSQTGITTTGWYKVNLWVK
jgi:hypothetical protein